MLRSFYRSPLITRSIIGQFSTEFPHRLNTEYLSKLQVILKKKFDFNEKIGILSEVRLIDSNNKLIGVFSIDEARRRAAIQQMDLVLINSEVKPAICRVINYSEELGQKFLKEFIAAEQERKEKMLNKQTKTFKLGSRINQQDMKIKVQQVKEILRKTQQIKVQIICVEEDVEQSKNIIVNFKDMCREFLVPIGEIRERIYEKEVISTKKAADEPIEKQIELILRSVDAQYDKKANYSLADIKRFIDLYYNQTKVQKYTIPLEDMQIAQSEIPIESRDVNDEYEDELITEFNKKYQKKTKKKILTGEDREKQKQLLEYLQLDSTINLDHAYSERVIAENQGKEGIENLCKRNLKADLTIYRRLNQILLDIEYQKQKVF